ncbi:pyridine nucleotide-disulfide oxidoreductase, partial [Paenibacillus sepulcri]|nr:pyridine nucleotide-disulfide oxidoreductase [Paenibacillus sepulcri]
MGVLVPVDPELNGMDVLITAAANTMLTVEIWHTGRGENYVPHTQLGSYEVAVAQGESQWVHIPAKWRPESPANAFVIIKANEAISLHTSAQPQTGILVFEKGRKPIVSSDLEEVQPDQPVVQWSMRGKVRKLFCIRLTEPTEAYSPDKIAGGFGRPYGGPQLWS